MSYAILDDALESIADAGPELANGLTNHAPMAIEALCALDRSDAIRPWLDHYRPAMLPRPPSVERIQPGAWKSALACPERFADFRELIADDLKEAAWPAVLDRWTLRLVPGISAAAMHGVIRVGHAVRALAESITPPRLDELASAIAYWASSYQALPTRFDGHGAIDPRQAIAQVAVVPAAQRKFAGTITSSLEALDEFPAFATVIGRAKLDGDSPTTISHLTETFAKVYLANAHDVLTTIVFIHGVTSATAVRSLIPHVCASTGRALLPYLWQAECALYATFGARPAPSDPVAPPPESRDTLIARAVANGDEHVIKFTETCLREDALNPSPIYRAAACHAIKMINA
jgi:hypothetical protein